MDSTVCKNIEGSQCQLRTRFKVNGEIIYVIRSMQEEIPSTSVTTSGERIRSVVIGSRQHLDAVQDSIYEIQSKIRKLERENNIEKREKAEDSLRLRENELMFLKQNCTQKAASDGADSTAFDGSDKESVGTSEESSEVIHVTAATFGQISKLKIIEHKKSHDLFPRPVIRQYIIDGVIHRTNSHMHVPWLELFLDLIYVGTVQKAGHYIEKGGEVAATVLKEVAKFAGSGDASGGNINKLSWKMFLYFVLLFTPIMQRWRTQTYLFNQIMHHGPVPKVLVFVLLTFLIIMGSTMDHAFDLSPVTNTGNIFIAFHVISSFVSRVYWTYSVWIADSRFKTTSYIFGLSDMICHAPYLILYGFPADGTEGRMNVRVIIWALAMMCDLLITPISVTLSGIFKNKYFIGLNIEHAAERFGLFIIIILGEVIINIMVSFTAETPLRSYFDSSMLFLTALSLFYIYFRAESGKHHQHALRRSRFTGIMWGFIHLPISISIISVAYCLKNIMLQANHQYATGDPAYFDYESQTILGASYAILMISLCILTLCHIEVAPIEIKTRANAKHGLKPIIPIVTRLACRLSVGIVLLIVSLTIRTYSSNWIIITTFMTFGLVVFEEYGRRKIKCPINECPKRIEI